MSAEISSAQKLSPDQRFCRGAKDLCLFKICFSAKMLKLVLTGAGQWKVS